ncbi:MAG: CDP-alcohol phosphatidyltransferase family protein, partial [Bacteroidota bacterium]
MSSENRTYGKHLKVTGRIFTLSNFISFTRLVIAVPIIAIHYQNEFQANITIVVLVVYAALSDYLDGLVARLTNTVSEMGKIIDPVADKLAATGLFAYTVWIGWVPEWFLLFSILRDGLIMMGSYYIRRKYEKVAMSVLSGKLSV